MCVGLPIASSSGRSVASYSASGPPTMIAIVASTAPLIPPDTGASKQATPRGVSAAAISCAACGPEVDRSQNSFGLAAHENAVRAERGLAQDGGRRQAGEHHFALPPQRRCRSRRRRALLHQCGDGVGREIVHEQVVPGLEQIARHRRAHAAEAKKTDCGHKSPLPLREREGPAAKRWEGEGATCEVQAATGVADPSPSGAGAPPSSPARGEVLVPRPVIAPPLSA